jgi:biotin operon repressor
MKRSDLILCSFQNDHTGKSQAISIGQLSSDFHVSKTTIRRDIAHLRRSGYPICSGKGGFYYAASLEDIDICIEKMRARAQNLLNELTDLSMTESRFIEKGDADDGEREEIERFTADFGTDRRRCEEGT